MLFCSSSSLLLLWLLLLLLFSVNVFKNESIQRYFPLLHFTASMSANTCGPIEQAITEALQIKLQPIHLEVVNESYMHNVPKGAETHFKVLVVSEKFESLPLIKVGSILIGARNNCNC